ncbi:MAG: ferritin-like domain-containing protein [bacterium]
MKSTFNAILAFAIEKELEASEFYKSISALSKRPNTKQMFEEFAREELKHKELLESINENTPLDSPSQKIVDLKISDYLVDISFKPDIGYQDALIIAMKREEKSVKLYNDLAEKIIDEKAQKLLKFMAEEELKHKLRLETEYDENVLVEG